MAFILFTFLIVVDITVFSETPHCPSKKTHKYGFKAHEITVSDLIESPLVPIENVPYTCGLIANNNQRSCTCAIISERFLVTAAHCMECLKPLPTPLHMGYKKSMLKGVVGANSVREFEETDQNLETVGVKVHEKYKTFVDWDIALVLLKEPIQFSDKVKPIDRVERYLEQNEKVYLSGYGNTYQPWFDQTPEPINRPLRGMDFIIISQKKCQKHWDSYHQNITIHNGHVCIKSPLVPTNLEHPVPDPCTGDSGGPAVTGRNPKGNITSATKLVGVYSFSNIKRCGDFFNPPAIYTSVFYYKDWILESMAEMLKAEEQYYKRRFTKVCTKQSGRY